MSVTAEQAAELVASGAAPDAAYVEKMTGVQPKDASLATTETANAIARPEHIPEKFWDAQTGKVRVDDLAKSYAELEKLRSKPAEAATEDKSKEAEGTDKVTLERPEEKKGDTPVGDAAEIAKVLQAAGISFDDVNAEYQKSGEVSEETRTKLESAFGKDVVANYFAGLRALEASAVLSAHEAAGGKEVFEQATKWGAAELSDEDFSTYNDLVSNPKTAKQGVEWLVSKYRAANMSEGKMLDADPNNGGHTGDVFKSTSEMTTAMRDPRYATSPDYRREVAEKLARSRKAGTLTTSVTHHTQRL